MPLPSLDPVVRLIKPTLSRFRVELVEAKWGGSPGNPTLRLLIDRDEGVTVDDCERVSNAVSVTLDAYDPIGMRYQLEVSSPGAERPLISDRDYQRAISHVVKVKFKAAEANQVVQGHLVSCNAKELELLVAEKKHQHTVVVDRKTILEAHRVAVP